MKKVNVLTALVCAVAMLVSCIPLSAYAAAGNTAEQIRAAAEKYIKENKNAVTKEGLLAAAAAVDSGVNLEDSDLFIYYAQPSAEDDDSVTGYKLNIPGNNGAVTAVFNLSGEKIAVTGVVEREKEVISAENIAVAGKNDGKLYYDTAGNIIGCAEGVDKIVIPESFTGTMGKPDFEQYPAMNGVKTVIIRNTVAMITEAFDGSSGNWSSLKALDINGGKGYFWTDNGKWLNDAKPHGLAALKYLYLPFSMDNGASFAVSSFCDLPSLETANIPVTVWYQWGCFRNTGIRQFILGGHNTVQWAGVGIADAANCFAAGKTVSVIQADTEMTFAAASAIIAARVSEQVEKGAGKEGALTAAQSGNIGWSEASGNFLKNLTLLWESYTDSSGTVSGEEIIDISGVLSISDGTNTATAEISCYQNDSLVSVIRSAMAEYLAENRNNSTLSGLLRAVRSVAPNAELSEENFSVYYAQPSVTDDDTVSGYQLNIPGNDGAAAASFDIDGRIISFACAFERERETIKAENIAVAGANDGKLTYDENSNIIGCADGVDKIVIPESFTGTMGKPDFARYPAMNGVKTVIIRNTVAMITEAFDGSSGNWSSLEALVINGGKTYFWSGNAVWLNEAKVHGLSALKYLYLPIAMDNGASFAVSSFCDLPLLETVNVPVTAYYQWGCFRNTGIRQFILGGHNGVQWAGVEIADAANCFAAGETVSVIKADTALTDVCAAAWITAAVNEQTALSDSEGISTAKTVLGKRAWSETVKASFEAASLSFAGNWNTNSNGCDTRLVSISDNGSSFYGQLVKTRIRPTVALADGASVRAEFPAGLRFSARIGGLDELTKSGAVYQAGMLIVPEDMLSSVDFTEEALKNAGYEYLDIKQSVWACEPDETDEVYGMNAVISEITPENYNRAFAARAYVDVAYADGTKLRYYSDYSAERNTASAYGTAIAMLNDAEAPITDPVMIALLRKYVKKVEKAEEKIMYADWNAETRKLQVVQNYSASENFVAVIKPTGINKIINIAPPRFIANTDSVLSTDLESAYERSGAENMSESDWLSPHNIGGSWYGGTHGTTGESGEPTGFSDNVSLKINGKTVDAAENISRYAADLEITWDTYAGGTDKENAIVVEHHTLRFDGVKWRVRTELEFLADAEWNAYYGMQCVYGVWNGTVSYDGNGAKSISQDGVSTDSNIRNCEKMLFNKGSDYLEMYIDSHYGLGDRRYLSSNNGAFTISYNVAKNGKAYFRLVDGAQMKKGDTVGLIGSYRFYSSKALDRAVYNRSVLNEGAAAGTAKAMKKAQNGEAVTVGVIGGSITQGSKASSSESCYAGLLKKWWQANFPDSELTFINAGKGDTTSLMGVFRAQEDLLRYEPDFVTVEFSVNDPDESIYQSSYEGLVRRILNSSKKPGVLMIEMMNGDGVNRDSAHTPVAKHYNLPIISYKEALWPTGGEKLFDWGELSPDTIHPNDFGHSIVARLVTRYLDEVRENAALYSESGKELPEALCGTDFDGAVRYNHDNFTPESLGAFVPNDNTYQFASGWTATGSGDAMTFSVKGAKHIYIMYHQDSSGSGGQASVSLNGSAAGTMNGDFSGGWNRAEVFEVVNFDECGDYTVTVKPVSESGKKFSILGILVS